MNNKTDTSVGELHSYDTDNSPPNYAFGAFRETLASAFMPWSLERRSEREFSARIIIFSNPSITLARTRMTPLVGTRGQPEISNSPEPCLYANYVIAGQLIIEQNDRLTVANPGDLIIYDSTLPVKHIENGMTPFEDLSFSMPKNRIGSEGRIFENTAIPGAKILAPLASCFEFLAHNISSSSPEELSALGFTCSVLLPLATASLQNLRGIEPLSRMPVGHAREMMHYIESNLASGDLTPRAVARHLGLSVRYVHKIFAKFGTTFGDYVRAHRLERISSDLISEAGRHRQISDLAFRWGFNDLSTFARAFRNKYGCSPSDYRDGRK